LAHTLKTTWSGSLLGLVERLTYCPLMTTGLHFIEAAKLGALSGTVSLFLRDGCSSTENSKCRTKKPTELT